MIYDLPKPKGSLNPLPFTVLTTVTTLAIGIQIIIFDGDRQSRANTDEVTRLQEIIPVLPELCTRARPRC
jgi:hypothetical protein